MTAEQTAQIIIRDSVKEMTGVLETVQRLFWKRQSHYGVQLIKDAFEDINEYDLLMLNDILAEYDDDLFTVMATKVVDEIINK